MGNGMIPPLTILLLGFLAGSLPLAILLHLQQKLHLKREEQWTRVFSVHSLAIPKTSMDAEEEKPAAAKKPDPRKRISIPLPVPDYAKSAWQAIKKGRTDWQS